MDHEFLLTKYSDVYGMEAGPWNLSVANKYLEYRITAFYEENFSIPSGAEICNVGIGAGCWDRYLSYHLCGGNLTSIDIDGEICRALELGLKCEGNPNPVTVIHDDVMNCTDLVGRFDIVTMVGSTRMETGLFEEILEMLFSFLKPNGSLYYQSLEQEEDRAAVEALCRENHMKTERYERDVRYGYTAHYWKIVKEETNCQTFADQA